jgi:hypothetical protein
MDTVQFARVTADDFGGGTMGETTSGAPDAALLGALEQAAEGLLYTSEGDHPLVPFSLPFAEDEPLTAAAFAAKVGAPADAVQERTVDRFLRANLEAAPGDATLQAQLPGWRRVHALLTVLRDARAFRIPQGHGSIDCYLVGRDGRGHLVGYRTTAIET